MVRPLTIAVGLAVVAGSQVAVAQGGIVRGVVREESGLVVQGASVEIVSLQRRALTDSLGSFRLAEIPRGEHTLSIRRLGYYPATVSVIVNDLAYSYNVVLEAQPRRIGGMEITASEARRQRGLADFLRRKQAALGGTFFTRADIAARNADRSVDVVRGTPGLDVVNVRSGVDGIRFIGSAASMTRACSPTMWLDGQRAEGLELGDIPVTDIEAIELYPRVSSTPLEFSPRAGHDNCGVIAVWTRIPNTP